MVAQNSLYADANAKQAIESGAIYNAATVGSTPDQSATDYLGRLLCRKFDIIRDHYAGGLLVELCCATGDHLNYLAHEIDSGIGIDLSQPFIDEAVQKKIAGNRDNIDFKCASVKSMPVESGSVDFVMALASLYTIPDVSDVLIETSRCLKPGGRCVLEFGNYWSLNTLCVAPDRRPLHLTLAEMKSALALANLHEVEHFSFQVLPLWTTEPRYLWPFLHPMWKRLMAKRVAGKMLDEWISSAPLFNRVAFRHIFVCEKLDSK